MGFRGLSVGKDTYGYFINYTELIKLSFIQLFDFKVTTLEPCWCLLAWITNFIGGNYLVFQLIISGIICWLGAQLLVNINKMLSGGKVTIIICLYLCYFYLISLNIARQIIAVLLVANSWFSYYRENYKKSVYLFIFALGFHFSSVAAIPLYIIWWMRKNRNIFVWIPILLGLFTIGIHYLMGIVNQMGMYVNYTSADATTFQEANAVKLLWIITGLLSICIVLNKLVFPLSIRVCSLFSMIYVVLNFLSSEVSYIERIGLYYQPFVIVILVAFGRYFKSKNLKFYYYTGMLACYSLWFIISAKSEQYVYSISSLL